MSVIKTVTGGVFWSSAALVAGKVVMFANVFLILSHLTAYNYGLVELVLSAVSIASLFMLSGLTSVVTVDLGVEFGKNHLGKMNGIFRQYVMLSTMLAVLVWAVFFFGAHPVAELVGNTAVEKLLRIISFSFLVYPFKTATQMIATVSLRYADQSFYGVLEEIWKFFFLILFLVVLKLGPTGLLIAVALSQLACVVTFLPRTLSFYRIFSNAEIEEPEAFWHLVRHHRKWGIATSYVSTIGQNMRIWIIKFLLGTEAVGLFAFATGLSSNLNGLFQLGTVLTPLVPKYIRDKEYLGRLIRTAAKFQTYLAIVFILIGIVTLPTFIDILFPKYTAAVPLILILLGLLIPSALTNVYNPVFMAYREQKSLLFATVLKLALSAIFLPIFILAFGITGLALEANLTMWVSAAERYRRLIRLLPSASFDATDAYGFSNEENQIVRTFWREIRVKSLSIIGR